MPSVPSAAAGEHDVTSAEPKKMNSASWGWLPRSWPGSRQLRVQGREQFLRETSRRRQRLF